MSGAKRFNTWRSQDRTASFAALADDRQRGVKVSAAEPGERRRFGCTACSSYWRSTQMPSRGACPFCKCAGGLVERMPNGEIRNL